MKTLMLAASAVVALAAPGMSLAQEDYHHGGGHPGGGGQGRPQGAASAPQPRPAMPAQAAPPMHGAPMGQPYQGGPYRRGSQVQGGSMGESMGGSMGGNFSHGGYPQAGQPAFHPPGGPQPGGQGGYRAPVYGQQGGGYRGGPYAGGPGFGGANRGGAPRGGGQPFSYGGRQYFRYRAAPYRYPGGAYGWTNHAWRRGEWLPPVFIVSSYFINDWYDFGLWQPDYGYEWIRVGDDAVLVNLADGQVVDVAPGVYYD